MKNRSDITYEELTLCKFTIQYNCKLFIKSDITYEELTLSAAAISLARDFKKCRTLPMRNWHHLQGECITKINHGKSDITYEELTHIISGPFIILSRDVISISRTLPMRNWHTGYRMFQSACLIRRTLPMRNWHYPHHPQQSLHQGFVGHYLWGIDTKSLILLNFFYFVGHYLWGIDTSIPKTFGLSNQGCPSTSDITYEELTHCTQICHWSDLMSDITYEELTPVSSLSSLTAPSIGRTLPMRNWHMLFSQKLLHHQIHLLVGHYLWGIDTFPDHIFFSS